MNVYKAHYILFSATDCACCAKDRFLDGVGDFFTVGLDLQHQRKEPWVEISICKGNQHTHPFIIHKKPVFLLDPCKYKKCVFVQTIV